MHRLYFRSDGFAADPKATPEEARKFIDDAEQKLLLLGVDAARADWVKSTYITDDTEAWPPNSTNGRSPPPSSMPRQSTRFDGLKLRCRTARKMKLLKLSLTIATPADPKESEELTRIVAGMEGTYGKGQVLPHGPSECLDLEELSKIMADEPRPRSNCWTPGPAGTPSRGPCARISSRYVELANKGARELGFADNGAMWRSKYDMPPDDFAKELDRLWEQVQAALPFAARLRARPAAREVRRCWCPPTAPSRRTCWATCGRRTGTTSTRWSRPPNADPGYDLTADPQEAQHRLEADGADTARASSRRWDSRRCPQTFWERSLFLKPRDRDVVCHASAWDVDTLDDLRLKMCIEITGEDFLTIHHELGHNFYQRAYNKQPFLFRDSANDGFHEAVGDTIALSVTPEYLVKIGPARPGAGHFQGHRPAAAQGAGEDRVPAVRAGDRPVALEGILGRDPAGKVQRDLVGACA